MLEENSDTVNFLDLEISQDFKISHCQFLIGQKKKKIFKRLFIMFACLWSTKLIELLPRALSLLRRLAGVGILGKEREPGIGKLG